MVQILVMLLWILLFIFGMCFFSFLNVVIYRVPKKISFAGGRSFCPSCKNQLKGRDMVPVFSYLFLRGRCRYCGSKISLRYPLVELLGGISAVFCMYCFGNVTDGVFRFSVQPVLIFLFLAVLTAVAFIDLDTMEIPNGLVLAAAVCGLASIPFFPEISWISRIIGIFSVSVPLLVITLLIPGAFGGGDIKLMAACGLILGWQLSYLAAFLAIVTGGIYGIYLLAARKKDRKDHFAFGPFLCVGMAVSVFWGQAILKWYFSFII